jgi:hypothetical protein
MHRSISAERCSVLRRKPAVKIQKEHQVGDAEDRADDSDAYGGAFFIQRIGDEPRDATSYRVLGR